VRESGNEKQQQLQEELLRGTDAEQERDDEQKFHLDQLDDKKQRQQGAQQSVLYEPS